jgi:hypothetical protein
MNSSVIATEMLKFLSVPSFSFATMKSSMLGWSTLSMPMFAPLLLPPCFTCSVAMSNTFIKEIGPEATPPVLLTMSLDGLSLEKEKPVPPPDWCIIAAFFTASNISTTESPTGSTKHALSWPSFVPAFISVGELGMNLKLVMAS